MTDKKIDIPFHSYLIMTEKGLALQTSDLGKIKPLYVDFLHGKLHYRRQFGGGKNQLIARAIGIKPHCRPFVIDATAGLGSDAFVLASLGCTVHMLEQHPIIAALLQDGLDRLYQDKIASAGLQLTLTQCNAIEYLSSLCADKALQPDVIYLDPMFPPRKKSALVKKEMRILSILLENELLNEQTLLMMALKVARKRVVVKRPAHGSFIGNPPNLSYKGQSCRFDVYFITHGQEF